VNAKALPDALVRRRRQPNDQVSHALRDTVASLFLKGSPLSVVP